MDGEDHRGLRVGLVGGGPAAPAHRAALEAVDAAELVAVCAVGSEPRPTSGAGFGVEVYVDLRQMLDRAQLDVVHVLGPPDARGEAVRQCLEANLDVLAETPMVTSIQDAETLAAEAGTRGLTLGVCPGFTYLSAYRRLREDVRSGALGPVDRIEIAWVQTLDAGYDAWVFADPGHVAWAVGAHPLAIVVDLLGPPDAMDVEALEPTVLPHGVTFFRRFNLRFHRGGTQCDLYVRVSTGGFEELEVRVRGSLGRGRVDLERNRYLREQHGTGSVDVDHLVTGARGAADLAYQAVSTFKDHALSRARLVPGGRTPIETALRDFYDPLRARLDDRQSPERAIEGLRLIERWAEVARGRAGPQPTPTSKPVPDRPRRQARVLVLGGTGPLGRSLVRQRGADGTRVRILGPSLVPGLWGEVDPAQLELVHGSIEDEDALAAALEGVHEVYHLAEPSATASWTEWQRRHVDPTRALARRSREAGVGRLVYASTLDVYDSGDPDLIITCASPLDPKMGERNPRCRAKAQCERLLDEAHRIHGLDVVIARPGIAVGPGASPFHPGVGQWSFDRICQLWGPGTNPLPFVLLDDAAAGLILAMSTPAIAGQSFNFIGDVELSGRDYVEALMRYAHLQLEARPTPIATFFAGDFLKWVVKMAIRHPGRVRVPSYRDWRCHAHLATYDTAATREVLGWRPETDRQRMIERGIYAAVDALT